MAVLQISKVQVRRGLQQDLPQLSGGEFGWSVDTRQLYIGNGLISEGAPLEGVTEILSTQSDLLGQLNNYVYRGHEAGYEAGYEPQTGTDLSHPSSRLFQNKLDDVVNVRDFGAVGDNSTDDTAAINRAITEVYYSSRIAGYARIRRSIIFPAGEYLVTGNIIKIPAWCRLVGDGINSTIIKQQDGSQECLFKFADSAYQVDGSLGSGSATLPSNTRIENMTLWNNADKDGVVVDSANNIVFSNVYFKGSLNLATSTGSYAGVRIKSSTATSYNISFLNCRWTNQRHAVICDSASYGVYFDSCYFSNMYKGIKLGESSSSTATAPRGYRITNCVFDSIANRAVDCYNYVIGVNSFGNHFGDVGTNFTGTPVSTVINFVSGTVNSIGDLFDRTAAQQLVYSNIGFNTNSAVAILTANVGLTLGTATIGTGGQVTLLDNQAVATSTGITLPTACVVNYSISRGVHKAYGTLHYTNNGSGPHWTDNYSSSDNLVGVVLSVNSSSILTYITSGSGVAATFKYNINSFS